MNTSVSLRPSLGYRLDPSQRDPVGSPPAETLERLIREEVAELVRDLDIVWREAVSGPAGPPDVVVSSNWRLDANIGPIGSDAPTVEISIGAILALDDLCLTCCCDPLFLTPSRAALALGDPKAPFAPTGWGEVAGEQLMRQARFFDYSEGRSPSGDLDAAVLHYGAPTLPWRLAQAEMLATLTHAFVLLHEFCHWGLGHLDTLPGDAAGLSMSEMAHVRRPAQSDDVESSMRRVMELQADAQAFMILTLYAEGTNGPCDMYEQDVARMRLEPDPTILSVLGRADRHRLCVVAASLACLALRSAQDFLGITTDTHPSPAARLMDMMAVTPILSDLTQQNETGDWILDATADADEALEELTSTVIGMSLVDLQSAASLVGLDILPLDSAWNDHPTATSDWLKDITAFWIVVDGEDEVRSPQSEAGRELVSLKALEETLVPALEALQIARFGAPFRTHLA